MTELMTNFVDISLCAPPTSPLDLSALQAPRLGAVLLSVLPEGNMTISYQSNNRNTYKWQQNTQRGDEEEESAPTQLGELGTKAQRTERQSTEHGSRITEDMVHTHRTTWPHGSHFDGTRGHSMAATRSENPARVRGWESDTFSWFFRGSAQPFN